MFFGSLLRRLSISSDADQHRHCQTTATCLHPEIFSCNIIVHLYVVWSAEPQKTRTTTYQFHTTLSLCLVSSMSISYEQQHPSHQMTTLTGHSKLTFCSVSSSMLISFTGKQQHYSQTTIATCHHNSKLTFCSVSSSMSISFTLEQQHHFQTTLQRVIVILSKLSVQCCRRCQYRMLGSCNTTPRR